jgi:hypothetical protein
MKTSELTGNALNWAVNYVEGLTGIFAPVNYCGKWEHGGPIIERERINLEPFSNINGEQWSADGEWDSPTPLIAAMRCYVASKLGEDVSIPEELA